MFSKENSNIIHDIYTPELIDRIHNKATIDNGLEVLHQILTSGQKFQVARGHLSKWLHFANVKGGLDEDRLSRLKQPQSYHAWQAVVNEIEVPYCFAKAFHHKVEFVASASRKGEGDFLILHNDNKVVVEVKTPYDPEHSYTKQLSGCHDGLDIHLVSKSFEQATGQVQRDNINLIVICTQLCDWIRGIPDTFLEYLFGEEHICRQIDRRNGRPIGPSYLDFALSGEFTKHLGGRYTRISAIASFDEVLYLDMQKFQFSLFFNCYASKPIDSKLFPGTEQFYLRNGKCSIENENESGRLICVKD